MPNSIKNVWIMVFGHIELLLLCSLGNMLFPLMWESVYIPMSLTFKHTILDCVHVHISLGIGKYIYLFIFLLSVVCNMFV